MASPIQRNLDLTRPHQEIENISVQAALLHKPEKFSGRGTLTFEYWVRNFQIFYNALGIGHNSIELAKHLPLFLTDGALDFYWELQLETKSNFDLLYEVFSKRYNNKATFFGEMSILMRREQEPHESVDDFIQDVLSRCHRIGIEPQSRPYIILKGLREDLRFFALLSKASTVEEIESSAKCKELINFNKYLKERDLSVQNFPANNPNMLSPLSLPDAQSPNPSNALVSYPGNISLHPPNPKFSALALPPPNSSHAPQNLQITSSNSNPPIQNLHVIFGDRSQILHDARICRLSSQNRYTRNQKNKTMNASCK